jgi:hypothetical protein
MGYGYSLGYGGRFLPRVEIDDVLFRVNMINREEELRKIDEFIRNYGVKPGPTAFVCASIQGSVPDRKFEHSDVKKKYTWMKSRRGKNK